MLLRRLPVLAFSALILPAPHAGADTGAIIPATSISSWKTTVVRQAPAESGVARPPSRTPRAERGIASYYWQAKKTASGEPFDRADLTAAHPTLPFHTRVKVTELASGRSVVVRINDRGPFVPGRVIDVSERAAKLLGFDSRGLAQVELEVLSDN
jgi:rare lipoprotein A